MFKGITFVSFKNNLARNNNLLAILLSCILILIPLKFLFSNIALIFFIVFIFYHKNGFILKFDFNLFIPILFYLVMVFSLFWTSNQNLTVNGLFKELPFLILPYSFMFCSEINSKFKLQTLRNYSFGMVAYAILCLLKASVRFIETNNKDVFLFHELVSLDVNAVYIAYFASFCLFYFIRLETKQFADLVSIYVLSVFVLLLASKTIIFIDICMLTWFYIKFSYTNNSVKFVTITMAGTFLFLSILYVQPLRQRLLAEYETAFVDNTINSAFGTQKNKVYNVSLKQAWLNKDFYSNDFIPGTALRVFHLRIFKELYSNNKGFFTGYGHDASQALIKNKYKEYKIFSNFTYFNFHNQFIQTFAELGFVGLFLLIAMFFINFRNAYINNDFLHTVFAFSTLILFLTESILIRQRGILFFVVLYCIFNAKNKNFIQT